MITFYIFVRLLISINRLFTQIFHTDFFQNIILEDQISDCDDELKLPKQKLGKGKTKTGKRRSWTKDGYFELDLLKRQEKKLNSCGFTSKFAGYSPSEVAHFFEKIQANAVKERETVYHARNKILLWLDRNHSKLSWNQVASEYHIGVSTGRGYVKDIETAILKTFKDTKIISFPSEQNKQKMVQILKMKKAHMPNVIFTLDGKHARCTGKLHEERLSWKYRWQPCFNCLFVIERVFGTVCAFNLDQEAKKHGITIFIISLCQVNIFIMKR